jgi:hypothetical protein
MPIEWIVTHTLKNPRVMVAILTSGWAGKIAHICTGYAHKPEESRSYTLTRCNKKLAIPKLIHNLSEGAVPCKACGTEAEFLELLERLEEDIRDQERQAKIGQAQLAAERNWNRLYERINEMIEQAFIEAVQTGERMTLP